MTNIPKLRFSEFENDGEWEEKKISDICDKPYSGGTPSSTNKEFYGGNIPFIRSAEINKEKTDLFLTDEGLRNSSAKFVQKGDVLVALYGANSGDVAISKIDGAINQAILCLNSKDSNPFLFQYFTFKKDWIVAKYIQGGQGNLSGEIVKSIQLDFPKPKEQQKIANCLSSVDGLIFAQSQKIELLKEHKKALMQQLFPSEGESVPKLRFPEFVNDGEWEEKEFSNLIDIIDGDRGINYPKSDEFFNLEYCLFLNAKNVTKNGFVFNEMQFITKNKDNVLRKGKLNKYDVVLTTRGSVGNFAFYSDKIPYENMRINSGMVILRTKSKEIDANFLFNYCNSNIITKTIEDVSFGNAQQQLTVSEIKKFKLIYPKDKQEQQKIADCLSSIDEQINQQTSKLQTLKEHKKALMQQLFPNSEA